MRTALLLAAATCAAPAPAAQLDAVNLSPSVVVGAEGGWLLGIDGSMHSSAPAAVGVVDLAAFDLGQYRAIEIGILPGRARFGTDRVSIALRRRSFDGGFPVSSTLAWPVFDDGTDQQQVLRIDLEGIDTSRGCYLEVEAGRGGRSDEIFGVRLVR